MAENKRGPDLSIRVSIAMAAGIAVGLALNAAGRSEWR